MEYPLASFCIVAYNEEKYISKAIEAAFSQDYPNMEIIMSDDGSSDRTYEIMKEMASNYKGPHKIILNKNIPNLGPRENYNKSLYDLSHGEYIFIADGDDISRHDRVSICVELLEKHLDVMSMSVASKYIDEEDKEIPLGEWSKISKGKYSIYTLADYVSYDFYMFSGDSRVLRRKVIESFPKLQFSYSEDTFLFVRSLLLGNVIYLREPLVYYRQRQNSIMWKSRNTKKTKEDINRFDETSYKQLKADFDFAVKNNYITPTEMSFVECKIEQLASWLRPKRKTIWWRGVHRLSKYSYTLFNKILSSLE